MIYRIEVGKIYNPLDWKLYTSNQRRVPLASEEALREYLKSHPDEDFFLIPAPLFNREVPEKDTDSLDPREDIRCGVVRYDSVSGKFITRDTLKVTYTDQAKQAAGFHLLQQATARLEEVLGASAGLTLATWDRTEDAKGRSLYTLRLSDWEGSVTATFTYKELQTYSQERYHWRQLWEDLLQNRSKQQLSNLTFGSVGMGE